MQTVDKPKKTPKMNNNKNHDIIIETTKMTPESTGTPMSQVSDLSDFKSPENEDRTATFGDVADLMLQENNKRRESRRNTASSTDIATLIDDLEAEDTEEMEEDEDEDVDTSTNSAPSPKMCPASIKKSKKKKKNNKRRRSRRNTASPGNVAALIDALQDSSSDEEEEEDQEDQLITTKSTPKVPKHRSQTPLKSILSVKSKPTNSLFEMFSGKKSTKKTTGKKKKKGVVFGSPQAAMFEKNKPANQMTPMPKAVTSQLFSMSDVRLL